MQLSSVLVLCCLVFLSCTYGSAQQAKESQGTPFKIETNVNRVLVPVVVRDLQGRAVGDLKKEDFQVFDNGMPHPVSAFMVLKRGAAESKPAHNTESAIQPPAAASAAPESSILPRRITVFLFDDIHLNFEDLAYAKKAGVGALAGALADSDMAAVVAISGKINSGLTRDRAKLQDAIMNLQPGGLNRSENSDCPNIDYYQADQIVNKHDSAATADAVAQVLNCDPGLDPKSDMPVAERLADSAARRALTIGYQDAHLALATIGEIVHRMDALPGQRTLILVSRGFLNVEPDTLAAESRIIDLAAQSNVTISTIDARGLYTTSMTASDDMHEIPIAKKSEFRGSAMRAVENVMAELADGTGGMFIHNSNDLDAGFRSLTEAPEYLYLLEIPLDNVKPDGSYHRLKVKVDRDGVRSQARRGYVMPKPEKTKK
jgi:VWFA-related protein